MSRLLLLAVLMIAGAAAAPPAFAQADFTVRAENISDSKAVFATVESRNVVPARARIGGTVAGLEVKEGDHVGRGQVIGTVGDEKIALQISAVDSQIAGYAAQATQAKSELDRLKQLVPAGAASPTALEKAQRDYDVALNAQKSSAAQKEVLRRQISEGQVLAPVAGRVLKVPVTSGTVIMPGETLATVAEEKYILRLQVPERHARHVRAGDAVRLDRPELGEGAAATGKIALVYPQIEGGRVIADAEVEGLGSYFVGERVRVWIPAGERKAIIVPAQYIARRFGTDYATIRVAGGTAEAPVQTGRETPAGVEILSGLKDGDVLAAP